MENSEKPRGKPGRPLGAHSKLSKEAREKAAATGALPHELLLQWGRGEPMSRKELRPGGDAKNPDHWVWTYVAVDADTQKESARAAAPYFAPKISTVEVITGVSDDDLDAILERAAAEAGVSLSLGGEGEEDEDQEGARPTTGRKRISLT